MVNLLYKGKMAKGIVQGLGGVEKGKTYDVQEPLLSKLIASGGWERINAPVPVKKKFVFEEKKEDEKKIDYDIGGD